MKYFLFLAVFALTLIFHSESLSCAPCSTFHLGPDGPIEVHVSCPAIPADCEHITLAPCGCCKTCAKKHGENCDFVECEPGLVCVKPNGYSFFGNVCMYPRA
ncbi:hypothetical protein EB796_019622 [Bugula neritina]|uniref:IGFBP N-terminal domain-containing protein n=1 Tax=Bugula neritina TaxID=10212 RepID=A0A7J7J7M6_BUGNE|nr:hypothetical protein EB796_019622 [Bugula neritina]